MEYLMRQKLFEAHRCSSRWLPVALLVAQHDGIATECYSWLQLPLFPRRILGKVRREVEEGSGRGAEILPVAGRTPAKPLAIQDSLSFRQCNITSRRK